MLPLVITKDVSPTGTHSVRIVASSGVEDTVPYVISDTPGVQPTTCILLVACMVLVSFNLRRTYHCTYYLFSVVAQVPSLGVYLINGSPRVSNDSVEAEFQITRPVVGVRCFLRSQFDRIWQNCEVYIPIWCIDRKG